MIVLARGAVLLDTGHCSARFVKIRLTLISLQSTALQPEKYQFNIFTAVNDNSCANVSKVSDILCINFKLLKS